MLQTLGPSLANAVIAALVFVYLWRRDREKYLAIWACAWFLWIVRYAYGFASAQVTLVPASLVLPLLALARGALVLWGSYALTRMKMPLAWKGLLALGLVFILTESATGTVLPLPGPPGVIHYTMFAISLIWSGVLVASAPSLPRFEARIPGIALIVFGAAQATFPLLTVFPEWYTHTSYVLVYALQALIPMGILMAYFERSVQENRRLHDALAGALTRALSEHIPICAHCKSIRDEDEWVRLERYVSVRTEATFSHGVCPSCFEENYPELGPYMEASA